MATRSEAMRGNKNAAKANRNDREPGAPALKGASQPRYGATAPMQSPGGPENWYSKDGYKGGLNPLYYRPDSAAQKNPPPKPYGGRGLVNPSVKINTKDNGKPVKKKKT